VIVIPVPVTSFQTPYFRGNNRITDSCLKFVMIQGKKIEILSAALFCMNSIFLQQSRLLWLKDGDANSKFLHTIISSRRRRNSIVSFVEVGRIVEGVQPICNSIFLHFRNHFKATRVGRPDVGNLHFKALIFQDGGELIKPFSVDEVKAAVWDCDSFKSLGPDGVNFGFIKDLWHVLGDDVMRFVSEFHRNGKLSRGINYTFIAFIPKVDNPHKLNDFRPISLVGSLYKILAKVLANRLRVVVRKVVSETQKAFVKDRQILDGVRVANKVVDEA